MRLERTLVAYFSPLSSQAVVDAVLHLDTRPVCAADERGSHDRHRPAPVRDLEDLRPPAGDEPGDAGGQQPVRRHLAGRRRGRHPP